VVVVVVVVEGGVVIAVTEVYEVMVAKIVQA